MSIDYDVPYYANTPGGTHCFQAALKMVLKYFWPNKDFNWKQLDRITAKQYNLWTWPSAGLCWIGSQGFDVIHIAKFDYKRFMIEREEYLYEFYTEEVARAQVKHSNIDTEVQWAGKFLELITNEIRVPKLNEIKRFLDRGYIVITNVNSHALTDREGYAGHFVVVKGYDDNGLLLHDPGGVPKENVHLDFDKFKLAWEYPNENSKNLTAIKL